MAETPKKIRTEAELQSLPEDGYIHEVANGELVLRPKNSFFHGSICTRITAALGEFNRKHRLGVLLDSSTGFWMFNRNCRAPDISFVTRARRSEERRVGKECRSRRSPDEQSNQ